MEEYGGVWMNGGVECAVICVERCMGKKKYILNLIKSAKQKII